MKLVLLLSAFMLSSSASLYSQAEKKAVVDSERLKGKNQFIQFDYLVIGGSFKKEVHYRAQVSIFRKNGKLLIKRDQGGKSETVELIAKRAKPEGMMEWNATFKQLGIDVSYLLNLYYDNHPVLIGTLTMKTEKGGEVLMLETAYPKIFNPAE